MHYKTLIKRYHDNNLSNALITIKICIIERLDHLSQLMF